MDMDLDSALRRLGEQPLDPRLAELEGEVMRLIAAERRAGTWAGPVAAVFFSAAPRSRRSRSTASSRSRAAARRRDGSTCQT